VDYSKFIKSIESQDERNIINRTHRRISDIPSQLQEFFNQYDPVDVEIVMEDMSGIKLYSYSYLKELQREYNLGEEYFIFATKNSDPIALHKQKVVIALHGTKEIMIEELASSFEGYISQIIETMNLKI
jgi:hypothetical protein